MRFGLLVLAAALGGAFSAQAAPTGAAPQASAQPQQGGRVIFVCDRSEEARRSFGREHGQMTFVTAEGLARAQATKESWTTPRCITAAELQRYELNATDPRLLRAGASR